jgi:sulfate permease, SulP family
LLFVLSYAKSIQEVGSVNSMAEYNYTFLVMISIIAGILLVISGLFKLGRIVTLVPHSIVVGFTIGIAIVIAFSQIGDVLGITHPLDTI